MFCASSPRRRRLGHSGAAMELVAESDVPHCESYVKEHRGGAKSLGTRGFHFLSPPRPTPTSRSSCASLVGVGKAVLKLEATGKSCNMLWLPYAIQATNATHNVNRICDRNEH